MIAGAGIVGIACAWYLLEAGYEVTIIDQGRIGAACSAGNCGFVCPSHVLPLTVPGAVRTGVRSLFSKHAPFRIKPQMRAALLTWFRQFARRCNEDDMRSAAGHLQAILDASSAEYRRLFAHTGLDADWHDSGLLFLFKQKRAFDDFEKTDALLGEEFGLSARRLAGDALQAFEPATRHDLAGGWYYDSDSFLRPEALVRNWAALARERGVEFVEDCELLDVHTASGRIDAIETSGGQLNADRYVFAIGAWSRRLGHWLECPLPVEPGKGYSMTMTRSADCPALPMIFEERHVGATPFDDGYRLGSMMEFAGFDTSIPRYRMQQFRDAETEYLKAPGGVDVVEEWYGWRPMTWDSLPIIGRVPRLSNALLATGHNMLGVTMAPATGRLIAELIAETPTHIDASPYSPARFAR